jgi:hypothetical protein
MGAVVGAVVGAGGLMGAELSLFEAVVALDVGLTVALFDDDPDALPDPPSQGPIPVTRSKTISQGCPLLPCTISRYVRPLLPYKYAEFTSSPLAALLAAMMGAAKLVPPIVYQHAWGLVQPSLT